MRSDNGTISGVINGLTSNPLINSPFIQTWSQAGDFPPAGSAFRVINDGSKRVTNSGDSRVVKII